MKRKTITNSLLKTLLCLIVAAMTGSLARASTNYVNFDSDPGYAEDGGVSDL